MQARGHEWALDYGQFQRVIAQDCAYCGTPPLQKYQGRRAFNGPVLHNGIDRKDNSLGYTVENSVPCCRWCNYAKRERTVEEFLEHARRIVAHQGVSHATR